MKWTRKQMLDARKMFQPKLKGRRLLLCSTKSSRPAKAPKFYELMKVLEKEADEIRRAGRP